MDIVIIEDEVLAAEKLEKMILRHDSEHQILNKIRSVEEAVAWFSKNEPPDILFLDIHLLDGTCFDIIKTTEIRCPVIFTTAYDNYALEAFQWHSVDYLLKPVSFNKLQLAFQKLDNIRQSFQQNHQVEKLDKVINALEGQSGHYKSRFLIKYRDKLFSINVDEIAYFFSEDRITFLVSRTDKRYAINYSLDELDTSLDPASFFRINRQMILHIDSIQVIHKHFKGRLKIDLLPEPVEPAMVSSRRVADFQAWLDR